MKIKHRLNRPQPRAQCRQLDLVCKGLWCGDYGYRESRLEKTVVVLDGAMVCWDQDGRCQLSDLLFRRGDPYFVAFDVLHINGRDLRAYLLNGEPVVVKTDIRVTFKLD
jgi:hypothetical protein